MPCYDNTCNEENEERRHKLARMLCGVCGQSKPEVIDSVPGLRNWWNEHQEFDRKRQADADKGGHPHPHGDKTSWM